MMNKKLVFLLFLFWIIVMLLIVPWFVISPWVLVITLPMCIHVIYIELKHGGYHDNV